MPDAAPAVDGWFTTTDQPSLVGARCSTCGTYLFPPTAVFCPNPACDGTDLERVELSRTGTIWSYTINHYAPPPPAVSPDPYEPYGVAAVELARDQLVVLGKIADGADLDALTVGMPVELVVEPVIPGSDEVVWKWRPVP